MQLIYKLERQASVAVDCTKKIIIRTECNAYMGLGTSQLVCLEKARIQFDSCNM